MNNFEQLAERFRELRQALFDARVLHDSPDRYWESELDERNRNAYNATTRTQYDRQTEGVIEGIPFMVAPACAADMSVPRPARHIE